MNKDSNKYERPDEIIVDGEIVKFHYSREERRSKTHADQREVKNYSIFAPENRTKLILMIMITLVMASVLFFTSRTTKNGNTIVDNLQVTLERKVYSEGQTLSFELKIRNRTKDIQNFSENILYLTLTNDDEEVVFQNDFVIEKINYKPKDFFKDTIMVYDLPMGKYNANLDIGKKKSIKFTFSIGNRKK